MATQFDRFSRQIVAPGDAQDGAVPEKRKPALSFFSW